MKSSNIAEYEKLLRRFIEEVKGGSSGEELDELRGTLKSRRIQLAVEDAEAVEQKVRSEMTSNIRRIVEETEDLQAASAAIEELTFWHVWKERALFFVVGFEVSELWRWLF